MGRFHLRVLGGLEAGGEGDDDVRLPLGKPLALLALIRFDRGGVTRSDAAALLWPESPSDRARASVRQALWTIRQTLDRNVVGEGDDGRLSADAKMLRTDLDELGDALARVDAQQVVDLWRGGPFHGFTVPDAPAWNQWASELHAEWERRVGEFLEAYASGRPTDDRWIWTEHALSVRPHRAKAHAIHIRALLDAGRKDPAEQALAQAHALCEGDLEGELAGIERAVHETMADRLRPGDEHTLVLPFVGREAEFASLSAALEEAAAGRSATLCLLGSPGIGKTRLAVEFLQLADAKGVHVARTAGARGERQVQLGLLGALCRQLLRLPGAAGISNASAQVLSAVVPSASNGSSPPAVRPPMAALGDALADLIDAVAEETPLVLFVDDLHWADAPSRSLLLRAIRLVSRRPVLLLSTCRSELGDATVVRSLAAEAERGRVELVHLRVLSARDVEQLLEPSVVFADDSQRRRLAEQIHLASQGHPLHVVSLVRSLQAQGALVLRDGRWAFDPAVVDGPMEMPAGLLDLLRTRLEGVSIDARQLLELLARDEGQRDVAALRRSASLTEARFADALAELRSAELIRWVSEDRVDFSHSLLRDVVGSGRRQGPGRLWRRVATLSAFIAVAAAALFYLGGRVESVPWEGTTIIVGGVAGIETFQALGSGEWAPVGSVGETRSGDTAVIPNFVRAGPWGREVIASRRTLDRGPDIVLQRSGGGPPVPLVDGGGDDAVVDLDPSGRYLLISVEDTEAAQYRLDLEILDLESKERRVILRPEFRALAAWSPDGRFVNALDLTLSGPDELLRLRPDGSVAERRVLPVGITGRLASCGPGAVLFALQAPEAYPQWHRLVWDSGTVEAVPWINSDATGVACSPDGEVLTFASANSAGGLLPIVALADGATVGGVPASRAGFLRVDWDDPSTPVPAHLAASGPEQLEWGGAGALSAWLLDQDGEAIQPRTLEWTSLDPLVVGTRNDSAVGNGPGVGRLVAAADGWLRDTIRVAVSGTPTRELLFAETFDRSWRTVWDTIGQPSPYLVTTEDDEMALNASGDAVWLDGIRSRQSFPVERGLTAEVQFRLPLTDRIDRQSIQLCLMDEESEVSGLGFDDTRRGICVSYPQGELEKFSAEALYLTILTHPGVFGIPAPDLGGLEWASFGIQLSPDGRVKAIVNGEATGELPDPVRFPPGMRADLLLTGRAEDTELLVRTVILWEGPRY